MSAVEEIAGSTSEIEELWSSLRSVNDNLEALKYERVVQNARYIEKYYSTENNFNQQLKRFTIISIVVGTALTTGVAILSHLWRQ